MPVEKSYARLGLFLVVALVVVLGSALLFIGRLRSRAVIPLVTYTTENVSGLDVSNPVRYRGVSVGRVTDVRVDPRGIMVEIDFEVFLDRLNTIGMSQTRIRQIADMRGIFPKLRAQVVGNPVTGEAYLLLDVPENPPPPPELGFTPARAYVATMPTTLATVQDRLPALLERAQSSLQTLEAIVARIPASLDRSDRFFTNVERIFRESELPALSADSRNFFTTTRTRIDQITAELDGLIGDEGTLVNFIEDTRKAIDAADLPATTQSARDAFNNTSMAEDDLRRSLPSIRTSLDELRRLARQLEDQPESVVYGQRPPEKKSK
jgi:phospholipid/cholesterol/gamma-HCH transport system substrate-binding protein